MSSLCRNLTMQSHTSFLHQEENIKTLWMPTVSFVQKYGFQREIVERIIKIDPYTNVPLLRLCSARNAITKCCHVNCYSTEHEFAQYIWCSAFCTCNNAFL